MTDRETRSHPEEGRIMAHLDGEMSGPAAARLEEHLEGCEACRRRREELAAASELLSRELGAGDVEVPAADPLSVRRFAADGPAGDGGEERRRADGGRDGGAGDRGSWRFGSATFWRAAVLVLGVGAAASATVPGSPVEGWISDAVRTLAASFSTDGESAGSGRAAATASAPGPQGVSVSVTDRAVVRITDAVPGLTVRVRTVEDSLLTVVARGARYRASDGVIEVVGADAPDLRIDLPAGAVSARVSAGGVVLLERAGGQLRVHAPRADTADGTISFSTDGTGD